MLAGDATAASTQSVELDILLPSTTPPMASMDTVKIITTNKEKILNTRP